jgi:hypothetical protein
MGEWRLGDPALEVRELKLQSVSEKRSLPGSTAWALEDPV